MEKLAEKLKEQEKVRTAFFNNTSHELRTPLNGIIGLAFKFGAVPFHMWLPDVYEGSPTPVVAFMASGIKVAGFAGLELGALVERDGDVGQTVLARVLDTVAIVIVPDIVADFERGCGTNPFWLT